jgi:ABC-type transport system substrate-binding protein
LASGPIDSSATQCDPKSPWHDKRLRQAVSYALDRKAINEAACLGLLPPGADPARREALLHKIQQLTIDRVMFAPIMDYRTLRGVGPRLGEHALDALHLVPFPAYEEMRLKGQ